jgi:hypothetical protein
MQKPLDLPVAAIKNLKAENDQSIDNIIIEAQGFNSRWGGLEN